MPLRRRYRHHPQLARFRAAPEPLTAIARENLERERDSGIVPRCRLELAGDALLTFAFQLIGRHYGATPDLAAALQRGLATGERTTRGEGTLTAADGRTFPIGVTTVTCWATDSSGNTSSAVWP